MAKRVFLNKKQTKDSLETGEGIKREGPRDEPEGVDAWEAEIAAIEQRKREAEEAKRAYEEARKAMKAEEQARKEWGKRARQEARSESKKAKKAKKGPRRFAKKFTSLHISDTSLRLLATKGRYVTKWAELPLEPGLVNNGLITNPEAIAEKIKTLFHGQGIKRRKVITGFSGLHCLSRVITLPLLSGPVLAEAIRREAEREMPISLDSVYLAWQVVHISRQELKVFLIAYTRNVTDALVQTLRKAGIKPHIIDLTPLAITRVVNKKTAVIVDARPSEIDIVIMVDGVPELIRSLPLPQGKRLIEKLPIIKDELERTIKFYHLNEPGKRLDDLPVFVCGELVAEPELYHALSDQLRYTVQPALPPLKYPDQMVPTRYMVNIGLILKQLSLRGEAGLSLVNLNALPDAYRRKRPSMTKVLAVPSAVAGVGIIVAMVMLLQNMASRTEALSNDLEAANLFLIQKQASQNSQNAAIAELEKNLTESAQLYGRLSEVSARFSGEQNMVNGDFPLVIISKEGKAALTGIKYSSSAVTLTGNAPTEQDVLSYARALEASGRYSQVILAGMSDGPNGTMNFSLILMR